MSRTVVMESTSCSRRYRETDVVADQPEQPIVELSKTTTISKYVGLICDIRVLIFSEFPKNGDGLVICSSVPPKAKQSSFVLSILQTLMA